MKSDLFAANESKEDLSPLAFDWIRAFDPASPQCCRAVRRDVRPMTRCDRIAGHGGRHAAHAPFSNAVVAAWHDDECAIRTDGITTLERARNVLPFSLLDEDTLRGLAERAKLHLSSRLLPWQVAALTDESEAWLNTPLVDCISGMNLALWAKERNALPPPW